MDKVIIKDMQVYAYHGALPEENVLGQNFFISLEMMLPLKEAGMTDDLTKGVSYAEVYERVEKLAKENTFKLIETLAERTAKLVVEEFPVESVKVTVRKPQAPIPGQFDYVAVEIERSRGDYE
ncbi:7,8-dihydroneopterin aldolase [Propionigenium maris DSM 9537]|uniref:7,8-dihydroneopterin aldolase n=1 Tax=Propionigenium maris DSM 9537 TaxID=1123000 RepID=A0A9W6LM30_9FUSO|nr:dihydroneopterin aldolase [Propionigenium maris]GLI55906.1 7,8-dihydroneopterin aldolase [Propionigenium maris DSM 9537]